LGHGDLETHEIAEIIAGAFAFWSIVLSSYLVYKHFRNYTEPELQRPIVRILFMVPVYAIDSWLSLRFKDYALAFDLARDCYESYVIYQFFVLLLNFLSPGDRTNTNLIQHLEAKEKMKHPSPFCCLPKFQPGENFLQVTRICILQFTIIKPLLTFVAVILFLSGSYDSGDFAPDGFYLWETIIDNFSITLAMYFLVLFYMATKDELKPLNPVGKFIAVKAVVFFSFWQGVLLSFLQYMRLIEPVGTYTAENIGTGIQDVLICVEMFLYSLYHMYVFDYAPYNKDQKKKPFVRTILSGDIRTATVPLLRNFQDSINPKHDVLHAKETFQPAATKMKEVLIAASGSFKKDKPDGSEISIELP